MHVDVHDGPYAVRPIAGALDFGGPDVVTSLALGKSNDALRIGSVSKGLDRGPFTQLAAEMLEVGLFGLAFAGDEVVTT